MSDHFYVLDACAVIAAEAKVRSATLVTSDHHEFEPVVAPESLSVLWIR